MKPITLALSLCLSVIIGAPALSQEAAMGTRLARWRAFLRERRAAAPMRLSAAVAAVVILVLVLVPGQYRIGAQASIEGEIQRAVVAPFDGFVASASVRAGLGATRLKSPEETSRRLRFWRARCRR